MRLLVYISFVLISSCLFAQEKNEFEKRVDRSDFPEATNSVLRLIPSEATKLRYYKESDGDHISFEAKFKLKKRKYSVEFSEEGTLEDVEVTKKFKYLDEDLQQAIRNDLDNRYNKWRIEKTQIQFTSIGNAEETKLNALEMKPNSQTGYELIIATKKDSKISYFEVQYDSKGTFRRERRVIRRAYDFVLF